MPNPPALVAFGALAPCPAQPWQQHIKSTLQERSKLKPVGDALHQLPSLYDAFAGSQGSQAEEENAAKLLAKWADDSELQISGDKRNAIIMPMTVITHIVQYRSYINGEEGLQHSTVLEGVRSSGGGVQGLCAGLLSALAVASSSTEEELGQLAALAVKLAFCVGLHVDFDQGEKNSDTNTSTIAVRWGESQSLKQIEELLLDYPGSYVSVVRDVHDATIVCPTSSVEQISQALSQHGSSARDIGLAGRYHTSAHRGLAEKILDVCQDCTGPFRHGGLVRSNIAGAVLPEENAAIVVLRSILEEQAQWHSTVTSAMSSFTQDDAFILAVGSDARPPSTARGHRVKKINTNTEDIKEIPAIVPEFRPQADEEAYPDNAVAVIGMGCKFPGGADSLAEFWDILSEGTSCLDTLPEGRWPAQDPPRTKMNFYGNFVHDIDAWDHRFFKKSPREAAATDPQQRILMQVTYHALESSGYFSDSSNPRDIGVYLGACATDYDFNTASHSPTGFSTVGTLRAFLSGKISHYFGWHGPSLTFDTACSSSAVAIHTACKAILNNECSQAVAGGATLFTSPYLYENLNTGHFLSPTGATKPFDASADGYCRGEGIGVVILKKLKDAIADGDPIRGVVLGSGINQNNNCVPIMVPHSQSQGNLYQKIAKQAGVDPLKVDFVEAHGTGTPVGDPIEMESIRGVFGGANRDAPLAVSSVKGNIGHLEGASGVAALIKAVLQMEYRKAVPQASYKSLNPKIPALEPDNIYIPTSLQDLPKRRLTACINNYGAAGSNATLMLTEGPSKHGRRQQASALLLKKQPIRIGASSPAALLEYCRALDNFIDTWRSTHTSEEEQKHFLPNLSYNLARRQNQGLAQMLTLAPKDIDDLQAQLRKQQEKSTIIERKDERPVVLCFGGQGADNIALDKRVWESSALLRYHLEQCDTLLREMGYPGVYPYIFQSEPVKETVIIHTIIFATQYACAQSWIDSGLKVDTVIGHSLGQLTALVVSGTLSLRDGLKYVAGRATIMDELWGEEPGTMVVLDADIETSNKIMADLTQRDSKNQYEIACYNGHKCQVVVSDKASASVLEAEAKERKMRFKRLDLEKGFHSRFCDDLYPQLYHLAESLEIHEPTITLETCSEGSAWTEATPKLIADHTRDPVFFTQAVERVAKRLGPATYLEAGSNSTVIGLTARIVPSESSNKFLAVALNKEASLEQLVDTTSELWKRGHQLKFWNHHALQRQDYDFLTLPSYQFEKSRHWLELVPPSPAAEAAPQPEAKQPEVEQPLPNTMVSVAKSNAETQEYTFNINPACTEYTELVKGHALRGGAVVPPSMYVEIVARALALTTSNDGAHLSTEISDIQLLSPLRLDQEGKIVLTLQGADNDFDFFVTRTPKDEEAVRHVEGTISTSNVDKTIRGEFKRFEKLAGRDTISSILKDPESESIKGSVVYRLLSPVVDYADIYRGVQTIASLGHRVAGKVRAPPSLSKHLDETAFLHPALLNCFTQVAGVHANYIANSGDDQVFKLATIDSIRSGPDFEAVTRDNIEKKTYEVLALATSEETGSSYDIFVYDVSTGRLAVLILGALFASHDAPPPAPQPEATTTRAGREVEDKVATAAEESHAAEKNKTKEEPKKEKAPAPKPEKKTVDTRKKVFESLSKLMDLPEESINGDSNFDTLGIDSLTMIEAVSGLSQIFDATIPMDDVMELADVDALVDYVKTNITGGGEAEEDSSAESSPSRSGSTDASASESSSAGSTPPSTKSNSPERKASGGQSDERVGAIGDMIMEYLDIDEKPDLDNKLADLGFDSLLVIEMINDINKKFNVEVELDELEDDSTFRDLVRAALGEGALAGGDSGSKPAESSSESQSSGAAEEKSSSGISTNIKTGQAAKEGFQGVRLKFDQLAKETGFAKFWENVYPWQAELVQTYIVEAMRGLGCDLAKLKAGAEIPSVQVLDKNKHLLARMHKILAEGNVIEPKDGGKFIRTTEPIRSTPSKDLYEQMLQQFPQHASETKLLNVTASCLADCLTGKADPLRLLFADATNKAVLTDVYDNAPMCATTTQLLAEFLAKSFTNTSKDDPLRIIEVGAGTGGTARYLIDFLRKNNITFEYTFTDLSGSLVNAAKRKFGKEYPEMKFMPYNCDDSKGTADMQGQYHVAIATNCIHATPNALTSARNMGKILVDDGLFCLVEFTTGLYWFDLVYGLLEGWWLFDDGRKHALADENFWETTLTDAGFSDVDWTTGESKEANTMRLIRALKQ